ncbi:undecaprenyl-diphosphate phosphatase [Mangrovimicrobium sediminis]|uniref:Undecaprenyl-diphosphatase n=1 Tax=Mangrovimicrobium sediminis TaxID=2562682 RepID=A0A4Z0M5F8_9GAMM|nr:undecaprenyl-diphosphate phosphatase [Haliea sp. SAOS-164]TGD74676.1 undecaprenyl-diphosphate phosphatase [Haliea sp. SAOS-164]
MIDWFQAVVLAILQGLTEFLPISSSAHLVIPSLVLEWPDQGLAFDVAVHVGTLSAVLIYYRRDLWQMAQAWLRSLTGGGHSEDSRLVWYLAVGSIPAGLLGVTMGDFIEHHARSLPVIATTTLVFGLLLGVADRYAIRTPGDARVGLWAAVFIGCAQAIALVPGVSRSGVTITAGLLLNLSRQDAARFSFLLSIPVIAGAGALKGVELAQGGHTVDWSLLVGAAVLSGLTAFACIAVFLRLLDRVGMMPFVWYRIVLAALLYLIWIA